MTVPTNLLEYVDDYFPGDATFEDDRASATLVFNFDWDDIESTLPLILGYAQKTNAGVAGSALSRTIPIAHPMFPWMYATRITRFMPYAFNGPASPYPAQTAGVGQGFALPTMAAYQGVRVWVQFEPLTYPVYSDSYLNSNLNSNEFNRFVTKVVNPRGEAVTLDRGQFVYAGTTTAVCCGVSKKVCKADIQWVWHQVPEDGAYNISTWLPTNQLALLGTVNAASFAGYPAQTLLLNSVKFTPHNFALQPSFNVEQAARYYDIEMGVIYFVPPTGTGNWNYLPNTSGGWSQVQSSNGGNPLYSTGDWTKLFTLN